MLAVAVLASGRGSNLQALADYAAEPDRAIDLRLVLSDRPDAAALARARAAGIAAHTIAPAGFAGRAAYDAALDAALERAGVELVVLAGFMRVLGPALVHRWRGRILNIHPSLLPKYRGLDTHRRVLAAGDPEHGASVHFVTETLDGGPVILQAVVPVPPGIDADALAARVTVQEHRVYPFVVGLFAQRRLALTGHGVELDGRPLDRPLRVDAGTDLACLAA